MNVFNFIGWPYVGRLLFFSAVCLTANIDQVLAADNHPLISNDAASGSAEIELNQPLRMLPAVQQVSALAPAQLEEFDVPDEVIQPGAALPEDDVYPIDLPSVLGLAGANNLQIALASERVRAAAARADAAEVLWIPSLNGGVVYNNHSGQLQATEGDVLNVNRSSLFVGGSAVMGNSPANGGASGPARMFVDLSLVDAIFEPLAARQQVRAAQADRNATFNDTLLAASSTYFNLIRAQARVVIAEEAVRNAQELAILTRDFASGGQGLQADADRASIEVASRQRDVLLYKEELVGASTDLARILRLDAAVSLVSADLNPMPIEFIPPSASLRPLISQAIGARPEVRRADAERDAVCYEVRQEKLRPWLPHLYAGASAGGFGGSSGSSIDNFDDRADFDVAALWEVENLGFGNAALRRETRSRYRQADLTVQQVRDIIATEVARTYQSMQLRLQQIEVSQPYVQSAQQALRLNLEGIRGGELRPIEIQQAIGALASTQIQYLDAVIDYNLAQLQLLRAVGLPPDRVVGNTVPDSPPH